MAKQIKIDDKYTYEYDDGHVRILRHGEPWLEDPPGAKAWIAAVNEIEWQRRCVALVRDTANALSQKSAPLEEVGERPPIRTTADDREAVIDAIRFEANPAGGYTRREFRDRDHIVDAIAPLLAAAREEGRQAGLAVGLEAADDVALAKHETEAWLHKYKAEIERLNRALQEANEAYRRDILPAHRTR